MPTVITVFHSNKLASPFSDEPINFPAKFNEVATITLSDSPDDEGTLNEAYQLSQNITSSWLYNKEVKSDLPACRSTSYGDVFKYRDNYYMVDMIGFKEIKPSVK